MDEIEIAAADEFYPIDLEQMRRWGRLPRHKRVRAMLEARELVLGLIRGRLHRRFPDLSPSELNMKVLREVTHVR